MPWLQPEKIENTLAKFDELLPDHRVKRIRETLVVSGAIDEETQLATYVQPSRMIEQEETGITRPFPAQAVFLMVTPNPHPRHLDELVKTNAFTPLSAWREDEHENRHSKQDTALRFFQYMSAEHRRVLQNWRELN